MVSTVELRALREATRSLLATLTPVGANEHVEATSTPPDRAVWSALATRLGLQGVRVPEDLGGVGLGLHEEVLVHEEMGRALHGGPFLPAVAQAVPALLTRSHHALVSGLLTDLVAGAAVVVPAYSSWYAADAAALEVDTRRRVHGVVPSVLEPLGADWLLVVADDGSEPVLGLVDATDCEMTRLTGVDLTRRFADVRFGGVELAELARGAEAGAVLAALEADGALALCADSVGLAGAAFEMTIDYLKVREQFGQPLGSFQGLKHQAADLLVLLESARSALAFAVESRLDGNPASARAALAVARRRCASAAFRITNAAIHLHGGIGFTWEHPVHLYHRRAKTNEVLLDPRGAQARVLADVVFGLYDHAGA